MAVAAGRWMAGRRVLGARFGGLGGFGGGIACKTVEPNYIGRCNITKIASSFPLCDGVLSRRAGQIGKFACQIVEWGRPLPAKISGCAPTLFRMPAETFRVLLFFLKWSLYIFCSYQDIKIVHGNNQIWITIYTCLVLIV